MSGSVWPFTWRSGVCADGVERMDRAVEPDQHQVVEPGPGLGRGRLRERREIGDLAGLELDPLGPGAAEGVPVAGDTALHVQRGAMYIQYQAGPEYCLPTCGELPTTPLSELTLFGSREHAEDVGLTPCSSCRPDLHPMPVLA